MLCWTTPRLRDAQAPADDMGFMRWQHPSPHACRVVFTVAAALLFENPPVHQPPPQHEHANGGIQQPLLSQVTHEIWPATLQIDR
jgi:hypothetical protein